METLKEKTTRGLEVAKFSLSKNPCYVAFNRPAQEDYPNAIKNYPQLLYYDRPKRYFLNSGLTRRMFDVIMLKPITSNAKKTDNAVSSTKL